MVPMRAKIGVEAPHVGYHFEQPARAWRNGIFWNYFRTKKSSSWS